MTEDQQKETLEKRTLATMKEYAGGEEVTIRMINSTLYVFGSELACLRIFAKYNSNGSIHNQKVRIGFSEPYKSDYISLEMEHQQPEPKQSNFCQFKIAYMLPVKFRRLCDAIPDKIFDIIDNSKLPNGWSFVESNIAGCSGFILIFETYNIPTQSDLDVIDAYIKILEKEEK